MQHPLGPEVRRALEEGSYIRAFETASEMLDGLTLREGLALTLSELEDGDLVLYDALSARWTALALLQGRASLNGVRWLASRFEEIVDPHRRGSMGELYRVVERNPQALFAPRSSAESPAHDREIVVRRTAAELAMLDAALARGDADAARQWMTPVTPLDRLVGLVVLLADQDDARVGAAARRLVVRFTAEGSSPLVRVAELAAVVAAVVDGPPALSERARSTLEDWRRQLSAA